MGIHPITTNRGYNMGDTEKTNDTVTDTKVMPVVVNEIKYTNKQAEVLKATCIDKLGEFDNNKWDTLKATLEANGAVFPLNNRSSIISTDAINKVDNAVMASNIAVIAQCISSLPPAKTTSCFPICINSIELPIQWPLVAHAELIV